MLFRSPPSNPHPYPWMNSLFQDGATISWLLGESLILPPAFEHLRAQVEKVLTPLPDPRVAWAK